MSVLARLRQRWALEDSGPKQGVSSDGSPPPSVTSPTLNNCSGFQGCGDAAIGWPRPATSAVCWEEEPDPKMQLRGAAAARTTRAAAARSSEAAFRRWCLRQVVGMDLLTLLGELFVLAVVTWNRGASYVAGCQNGLTSALATSRPELGPPLESACPDCGPRWSSDARMILDFPCTANGAVQYFYTLRHARGAWAHLFARRDDSPICYAFTITTALAILTLFPRLYLRCRHALMLLIRLCMMTGNLTAAAAAAPPCIAATTAMYYMPSYAAASGGLVNTGLFFMAVKGVTFGRVPLAYHVPFGLLEWCIAVVAAHTATRRTLGAAAAAAMTQPLWLLLHLAVYYALPCAMVAQIEAANRQRFRRALAAGHRSSRQAGISPPASAGQSAPTTPRGSGGGGGGAGGSAVLAGSRMVSSGEGSSTYKKDVMPAGGKLAEDVFGRDGVLALPAARRSRSSQEETPMDEKQTCYPCAQQQEQQGDGEEEQVPAAQLSCVSEDEAYHEMDEMAARDSSTDCCTSVALPAAQLPRDPPADPDTGLTKLPSPALAEPPSMLPKLAGAACAAAAAVDVPAASRQYASAASSPLHSLNALEAALNCGADGDDGRARAAAAAGSGGSWMSLGRVKSLTADLDDLPLPPLSHVAPPPLVPVAAAAPAAQPPPSRLTPAPSLSSSFPLPPLANVVGPEAPRAAPNVIAAAPVVSAPSAWPIAASVSRPAAVPPAAPAPTNAVAAAPGPGGVVRGVLYGRPVTGPRSSAAGGAIRTMAVPGGGGLLSYKAVTTTRFLSVKVKDHAGMPFPLAAARLSSAVGAPVPRLPAAPSLACPGPGASPSPQPSLLLPPAWPSAAAPYGNFLPAPPEVANSLPGQQTILGFSLPVPVATTQSESTSSALQAAPSLPHGLQLQSAQQQHLPATSVVRSVVVEGCVHLLSVVTSMARGPALEPGAAAHSTLFHQNAGYDTGLGGGKGAGGGGGGGGRGGVPLLLHLELDGMDSLPQLPALLMDGHMPGHQDSQQQQQQQQQLVDGVCWDGGRSGRWAAEAALRSARFVLSPPAVPMTADGDEWGQEMEVEVSALLPGWALQAWAWGQAGAGGDAVKQQQDRQGQQVERQVALRVVVAGTCGGVVADCVHWVGLADLQRCGGGIGREEHAEEQELGIALRLRVPQPRRPGVMYVHILPAPHARIILAASAAVPGSRTAHQPLATLPLLVMPSAASASEMCALAAAMAQDLQRVTAAAAANRKAEGRERYAAATAVTDPWVADSPQSARATAYLEHFVPFASDVAHLMACCFALKEQAAEDGTGSPCGGQQQQQQQQQLQEDAHACDGGFGALGGDVGVLARAVLPFLAECGMEACGEEMAAMVRQVTPAAAAAPEGRCAVVERAEHALCSGAAAAALEVQGAVHSADLSSCSPFEVEGGAEGEGVEGQKREGTRGFGGEQLRLLLSKGAASELLSGSDCGDFNDENASCGCGLSCRGAGSTCGSGQQAVCGNNPAASCQQRSFGADGDSGTGMRAEASSASSFRAAGWASAAESRSSLYSSGRTSADSGCTAASAYGAAVPEQNSYAAAAAPPAQRRPLLVGAEAGEVVELASDAVGCTTAATNKQAVSALGGGPEKGLGLSVTLRRAGASAAARLLGLTAASGVEEEYAYPKNKCKVQDDAASILGVMPSVEVEDEEGAGGGGCGGWGYGSPLEWSLLVAAAVLWLAHNGLAVLAAAVGAAAAAAVLLQVVNLVVARARDAARVAA